jgi:Cys-rich repeat protein
MRTIFASLLCASLLGCDQPMTAVDCVPACSANFQCQNGTCVFTGGGPDGGGGDQGSASCTPACSGATPHCNASGHCVGCLTDDQCPNGQVCKVQSPEVASCTAGCNDDSRCGGMKCCSNRCVDVTTSVSNCGMCGMNCSVPHAAASCAASKCAAGSCDPGWGDCDGNPGNGCEANLHNDLANCSMCGSACAIPHAIPGCSDGCYISACDFGYDDCNQDPSDGCETSVLSDIANCGGCGVPCKGLPNAAATCTAGNCVLGQCNVGFFNCDGNPQNGCEVAVGTDPNNCGSCGNVCGNGLVCTNGGCTCAKCNFPNAASSCVNNVCIMGACVQGFADCNNSNNDGCEVNLNSDPKNCGKCGMVCPQNLPGCFGGTCVARFQFQASQMIDGETVTCSKVDNSNNLYTECDDLLANGLYFPNGINCGPMWSMTQCQYSDTLGFCQALTGKAQAESYYTCNQSQPRASWHNHVWTMVMDNGYTQNLRCYY